MPIKTRRWNDPREKDDGYRLLVCRYRPRGVRKEDETWRAWCPDLGPSRQLHADFYGKNGPPITWEEYRTRYLAEMAEHKRMALMCAEAVPWRCHRSLIADALLARGIPVEEIISTNRTQAHAMTSFARVAGTTVTYPA